MRRKKIWPAIFLNLLLWGGWIYFLINFSPESGLLIAIFLLGLLVALGFFLSLIFKSSRQGFLISSVSVIFLLLRLLKMDNLVNLVILLALFLVLELYLHQSKA